MPPRMRSTEDRSIAPCNDLPESVRAAGGSGFPFSPRRARRPRELSPFVLVRQGSLFSRNYFARRAFLGGPPRPAPSHAARWGSPILLGSESYRSDFTRVPISRSTTFPLLKALGVASLGAGKRICASTQAEVSASGDLVTLLSELPDHIPPGINVAASDRFSAVQLPPTT